MTRYTGKSGTTLVCCRRPCSDPVLVAKLRLTDASQDCLCEKVVRVERSSWWLGFPLITHRSIRAGAFFTAYLLFQRTVSHLRSQKRSYWSQKSGSHPLRTLGVQSLGDPATLGSRTIQRWLSVLRVSATSLVGVTRVTPVWSCITLTFTFIVFFKLNFIDCLISWVVITYNMIYLTVGPSGFEVVWLSPPSALLQSLLQPLPWQLQ